MPILYEKSYDTTRVVVTAIRVQDTTNNLWYSWNNGTWDNSGSSGHNAPAGQAPQIAVGSPVYIAAYAVNKLPANACTMGLYIDGVMKTSVGQILPTNAGFGLEWNGTLTLATTAVEIKTIWVGSASSLEVITFSISPPGGGGGGGGGGTTPKIPIELIAVAAGGTAIAIGVIAYAVTRKK